MHRDQVNALTMFEMTNENVKGKFFKLCRTGHSSSRLGYDAKHQ